jgi:hypothetical protein
VAIIARHNLVVGGLLEQVMRETRTMMQPCASAARLLGGGPILYFGTQAIGNGGSPPPRIGLTLHRGEPDQRRTVKLSPFRRQNPREEPGALAAHAGICAGAGSNPRPYRDRCVRSAAVGRQRRGAGRGGIPSSTGNSTVPACARHSSLGTATMRPFVFRQLPDPS